MEIKETNQEVERKFKKIGIRYINMIAVGNSISSGYSMLHTIRPLLDYNETIKEDIEGLETYHFARAQDNCDAHIYKWLQNNYRLSDIYQMNRRDYELMPLAVDKSKRVIGMTPEMMDEYYSPNKGKNQRFKDLITPKKDTANIIIYNGGTGSFLDNLTRGGAHKLTYGIKKDVGMIDSFIQEVNILNERNPENNPTQVYLCGVPRFDIPLEQFINTKLRALAKRNPVVTYVKPPKCHLIQKGDNGKLGVDFHYSKEGYLNLNSNIMDSILNNYLINRSVIKTAAEMKKANEQLFYYTNPNSDETKSLSQNIFDDIVSKQLTILEGLNEDTSLYAKKLKQEIRENSAYEYYTLVGSTKQDTRAKQLTK